MKLTTPSINVLVTGGLLAGVAALTGCRESEDQTTTEVRQTMEQPAQVQGRQTVCPVMGGEINKDLYVDHDGKRIYVCCQGCIEQVRKDPEKYIQKLEADGVTLEP